MRLIVPPVVGATGVRALGLSIVPTLDKVMQNCQKTPPPHHKPKYVGSFH